MKISQRDLKRIAFDFTYHAPQETATALKHEEVRRICREAAVSLGALLPNGPEASAALEKMEEAMHWANASVAKEGARQ